MSTSSITTVTSLLVRVHDGSRLGKVALANHAHYVAPIYAESKSGVIHFTRSMSDLKKDGIRVNAVAPTFSPTNIIPKEHGEMLAASVGGWIPIADVCMAIMHLIEDESKSATVLRLTPTTGTQVWPPPNSAPSKL